MFNRLYVRIWLAVVLAVVVFTMAAGWLWRMNAEQERQQRPAREVILRNEIGEIVGQATVRVMRGPGSGAEFQVPMRDGSTLYIHLPRPDRPPGTPGAPQGGPRDPFGMRMPFDFVWLLGLVGLAVALGTYPIVRRLTKRLEALQQGVERWGQGDLGFRLPADGRDEVAFLAQRFNVAAQRVLELLQSQKSLLANASHELRSPLTRIRMGLELMGSVPSSDALPVFRQEIERNIAELDQLIDEILLASRLDAREADMGTVEAVDLVGLLAEECAGQAELEVLAPFDQQPVPLPSAAAVQVQGVTKLLRRAVRNLLGNAHRHAAGDVALSLQRRGALARIRVCDRGPGVPEALRERIFEPFYRLPGATERDGGVGLGLALVRSIALRHGGSVRCEDRPGGGACFVLELPIG